MVVERLGPETVAAEAIRMAGLDPATVDMSSSEVLAALIRRAASLSCPTSPRRLVAAVVEPLSGVIPGDLRTQVEGLVDNLIAFGDLLELRVVGAKEGQAARQLFLGPPGYVVRNSNVCLLLGVRPDGVELVSEDVRRRVECEGHIRRIRLSGHELPGQVLGSQGLREVSLDHWIEHPRVAEPAQLMEEYNSWLDAAGPAGDLGEVSVLDPEGRVTYYRGRWRPIRAGDNGRFVARRPQAFGADLWCYLEVESGIAVRAIDLPIAGVLARGCDEAWRLQAAIDRISGRPQKLLMEPAGEEGAVDFSLFSPLPSSFQRRMDVIGRSAPRRRGALFSYRLEEQEAEEEIAFLEDMMWLEVVMLGDRDSEDE